MSYSSKPLVFSPALVGLIILSCLLASACNSGSPSTEGNNTPKIILQPVGAQLTATGNSADNIFAYSGTIYLTTYSESSTSVSYYTLAESAPATVIATQRSLSIPQSLILGSYSVSGNLIVGNSSGNLYLPVSLESNQQQYLLSYTNNGQFINNLGTYSNEWIMPLDYGYEYNNSIYLNVDNGSGSGGNLCTLAVTQSGTTGCSNSSILPDWYQGSYVVNQDNVYFAGESSFMVTNIDSGIPRQIGQNDKQLGDAGFYSDFSPQLYNNNLYIVAMNTSGNLALCSIPLNSGTNQAWNCNNSARNIKNVWDETFTIDQQTGAAIVALQESNGNVQFYQTLLLGQ